MWSAQDLWGPRRMALRSCASDHGGVVNLTGAPLYLYSFRRRWAGWSTSARSAKSPRPRRLRTSAAQPSSSSARTSRRMSSPSSSEIGEGAARATFVLSVSVEKDKGRLAVARLAGGGGRRRSRGGGVRGSGLEVVSL